MKLKQLTLYGFKSFPDKTSFDFERGVTGIVGPNGCGKSNVVDAVRWTLGEQSARKLRGNEMSDVIFNGSSTRKPLGYCEVSLTFDNDTETLPVDYSEVCVTRRLYRSGESEYMLNKQPCRLKDIKEMFMDTGVGMDAYSTIEQGKVDLLLHANSKERRAIFEEAAGISRYKAKKREASHKLERTQANLLRAEDVIKELESRIRSLRRQAGKARRYKAFRDEMMELKVKFSEYKFAELSSKLVKERELIAYATAELREVTAKRTAVEEEITAKESRRFELDDQIANLQEKLTQLQGTIEASQERMQFEQRRIEELAAEKEKLNEEEQVLRRRLEELKHKIEEAKQKLVESENTLEALQGEMVEKSSSLRDVAAYEERLRYAVDEKKSVVVDLIQETGKRANRLGALSSEQQLLDEQKKRLLAKIDSFREKVIEAEERRQSIALQRVEKKNLLRSVQDELARLHARITSAEREITDLRLADNEIEKKRTSLESRRDLLSSLEARGEGLTSGVKLLLSHDGGRFRLVADCVSVGMEFVAAVEAALGERMQALITPGTAELNEGIRILGERGKAMFIARDMAASYLYAENGYPYRRLSSVVQCDEELRPVVEYLLGGTYLVDNVEDVVARRRRRGERFVTREGTVIEGAMVTYGKARSEEGGLIWRRTQMEEIGRELTRLAAIQARKNEEFANIHTQKQELGKHLRGQEQALDFTSQEIKTLEQDIAQELKERNRLEREITLIGEEVSVADTKLRTVQSEVRTLEEEIAGVNAEKARTEEEVRILNDRLGKVNEERKAAESALTSIRVKRAQMEETSRRIADGRAGFEGESAEKNAALARCRGEWERCITRREEGERAIVQSREVLERCRGEKAGYDGKIQELRSSRLEITNQVEQLNGRRVEVTELERSKSGDLQEIRIRENELAVRMDELQQNVRSEFDMELTGKGVEADVDWQAVEARIEEIKQRMASMGNVNLEAIDELAELEERAGFLKSQHEDLTKAKANLEEVIARINKTSRERFLDTFNKVREHFQEMFRKMFGGGKADVMLEEDVDVLDAGIEIMAKPPGKTLKSLSLLSGGEKSLTAVALLFSLFKSRPSPFCILDEVDAALDESNVKRFVSILNEFLDNSQFVMITHNKKSMSIADCLYGVTMQEPGVSKQISVRLHEAAAMAEKG